MNEDKPEDGRSAWNCACTSRWILRARRGTQRDSDGSRCDSFARIARGVFRKEWVRSLFALAVEDLRELCVARERERTFHLFESYDLDGNKQITYEQLSKELESP